MNYNMLILLLTVFKTFIKEAQVLKYILTDLTETTGTEYECSLNHNLQLMKL